jgi:hypothetical protein
MRMWTVCFLLASVFACDSSGDPSDASLPLPDADANPDGGNHSEHDAGSEPAPMPCDVVAPTECEQPAPTYADVEPIFQQRCVVCHAGMPGGPWPLTSYPHVASWFMEIRAVMSTCAMPPRDSGMTMPTAERELILAWLRCGYRP